MPLHLAVKPTLDATASDTDLVAACLAGERNAFAQIVERYQRLLCSVAYAATGSVSESEDLAQEAFIAAWGQLGALREPDKLRPWLCGILRHKVGRLRRQYGRDAVRGAEPFETAGELATDEMPAAERTMHNEEQAMLWRALEQLPERYREPLVLYYRENRSVEHVAGALDLTEDTVKQRLARGRKLLQEQALAFVEGALARTTPGRAFTLAVLAALPAMFPAKVKAAGIGAAAAHGGTFVKATGLLTLLASVSGVVSTVMQLRVSLDQSRTARERRAVVKATVGFFFGTLGFIGLLMALRTAAVHGREQRVIFAAIAESLIVAFIAAWPFLLGRMMRHHRWLRTEERRRHPELFRAARDQVGAREGVLRSRATLFGVPLVHVRFASPDEGDQPVVGWIAGGDRAVGLLFAWGGWAVAPVSVGAFAVGIFSIGGVCVGLLGLGTFATGFIGVGCVAVAVKAYAWLSALGWEGAQSSGGFAVARVAAEGPVALARHANDATAHALLTDPHAHQNQTIFLSAIVIATLVPMTLYAREVRRRLGPAKRAAKGGSGG